MSALGVAGALALTLVLPQEQKPESSPKAGAESRPKVRGHNPGGWPLPGELQRRVGGRRGNSDFEDLPAAPGPEVQARVARQDPGDKAGKAEELPPQGRPLSHRSPLLDLFEQMGYPSELRELGCVIATLKLRIFDHRGALLGEMKVEHQADLRWPEKDRLEFKGGSSGQKVFGRDGKTVFAELHNMAWPPLEADAREELAVFGLLLRMPWDFADSHRFVALSVEQITLLGRPILRLRVERRLPAAAELVGPRREESPVDCFDLIYAADRREPEEVRFRPAATGVEVVLQLREYRDHRGLRLPRKRIFLGPKGHKRMEMELTALEVGVALPPERFRPRQQ